MNDFTKNEKVLRHRNVAGSYVIDGQSFRAPALATGLYIVATPIGHLKDISLRALETLAGADMIACEDSRVTGRLLAHYGISAKTCLRYDDVKGEQVRPRLVKALQAGASVALVSDAGTPLISDPGFKLVKAVKAEGILVTTLPGASSVLSALVSSGLPTDQFSFFGFFPAKAKARRALFESLITRSETLIFFERMARLPERLHELKACFGARTVVIGRELTKLFEEVLSGSAEDLMVALDQKDKLRGEAVVLIEGCSRSENNFDLEAMLVEAMATRSLKTAVGHVADQTGLSRKMIYQTALGLKPSPEH